MYITQIDIELSGERVPVVVYAKQGDVSARRIDIGFIDNGTVYQIPDGVTARIWIKKPDGTAVYNDTTIAGNRVIADLTSQALIAAGDARAEIALYQGEKLLSTSVFVIRVERNVRSEDAAESSNEFGALNTLIVEAESSIPAATQAAADANSAATAATGAATAANAAAQWANETANDIIAAKNAGEFNGTNGVVTTMAGQYGFQVLGGNLYLCYADGETPPDFEIAESTGHLILTI